MLRRSAQVAIVVAAIELLVLALAATRVGVLPLVLVLTAVSVIGSVLLFRQTAGMVRLPADDVLAASSEPGRELGDRGLRILAAALLTVPGFVTGLIGAVLFLPPVRAAVRPRLGARLARSIGRIVPTEVTAPFGDLSRSIRRQRAVDVNSTVKGSPGEPTDRPASRPELH